MSDPNAPLTPPRLLWVEGKDDCAVVQSLCHAHQVPHVFEVQEQDGLAKLLKGIGVTVRAATIKRFGVVVDANGDVGARWLELRRIFEREGYRDVPEAPDPNGTIIPAAELLPRLGIWLMPDNAGPGALEEFAVSLIPAGDALLQYAERAVEAIPEEHRLFPAKHRQKAIIRTWLAWQESPGSPMGQAIGKGDLRADAPAAQRFVAWLQRLMVDEDGQP